MALRRIHDMTEVMRWFAEGRTPTWMAAEHERKYGVRLTPEAFINAHRRAGGDRTLSIRHEDLLPWRIRPEHASLFAPTMLRAYGRREAGRRLSERLNAQLDAFVKRLKDEHLVVHYDPDTEDGFVLLPARPGVDTGLIREPGGSGRRENRTSGKIYTRRPQTTMKVGSASL